jgi:putative addiction module killer protein
VNKIAQMPAAKVTGAIIRMERGNFGNVKGVGPGVFEYVLDFGPGYRIYFGKDGDQIIILLGGGTSANRRTRSGCAYESVISSQMRPCAHAREISY